MTKEVFNEAIEKLKMITSASTIFKENVYLVGGCVRDHYLGIVPKDIDLCIDVLNGSEIFIKFLQESFPKEVHGFTCYPRYGTAKFNLILKHTEVEIECVVPRVEKYENGPRKPSKTAQSSLVEDSKRRDFCCNSLYQNLWTGEIIDFTGKGKNDCDNRILRTPIDPNITFKEDPLRMLRAIRFSCTKEFLLSPEILNALKPNDEFFLLSKERIKEEFIKILMSPNAIKGITDLHKYGFLKEIIPELEHTWDWNQNSKYHSMTLSEHLFSVLQLVINDGGNLELRLAALLHDISKCVKYEVKEDGTYSFIGHELESAMLSNEILKRMVFPNKIINKVNLLIKNHMRIKQQSSLEVTGGYIYSGKIGNIRKLYRELGEDIYDLMKLIKADNLSHHEDYCLPGQVESFLEKLSQCKSKLIMPVTGKDIIEELKISPGKEVGEVKDLLQQIFDSNSSLTKQDLFDIYRRKRNL